MNFPWSLLGLLILLFLFATCQSECETTKWSSSNIECPTATMEIYREETKNTTKKYCCEPETEGERKWNKNALKCRVTKCSEPPNENLCSSLTTRVYQNVTLRFEEASHGNCTTSTGNTLGVAAYCCTSNSMEGLHASTYGAEPNEFPHMARLTVGGSRCGGTIYNKRFIITAAHCVVDKVTKKTKTVDEGWIAKLGRNIENFEIPANDYKIVEIIPHENYSQFTDNEQRFYNDIALLKLEREIEFGPNVKSIPLAPVGFDELKYADKAVIIGWGKTDTLEGSGNLQKADVLIRNDETCFEKSKSPWPSYRKHAKQLVCLGGILEGSWGAIAGGGDSGGPAICRGPKGLAVLCGISSFGGEDEKCEKTLSEKYCQPNIYVKVNYFRDWINENAGDQDEGSFYKVSIYGEVPSKSRMLNQVRISSDNGTTCDGTIISRDTVVTAAQCVSDGSKKYKGLKVTHEIYDDKMITLASSVYKIRYVAILDGFRRNTKKFPLKQSGSRVTIKNPYHKNDLAVIKLRNKVNYVPTDIPRLPTLGKKLSNSAYELAFRTNGSRVGHLEQREFTILDKVDCQRRMNRMEMMKIDVKVDDNVLCGVEKYSGGSTCDRELGGGIFCKGEDGKDILCGVQIFRLCEWSTPNFFIDMSIYSDWVRKVI